MNPRLVKNESEILEDAFRIHMYDPKNVLMPRGSMKKESIAIYILEHLKNEYETWTDKKYGDNPPLPDLIKYLYTNLMGEVKQAWLEFIKSAMSGLTERDELLLELSIIAATKPDPNSQEVWYLLEQITSSSSAFVTAVCFIDKYERNSEEFKYFTKLHMAKFIQNGTYAEMMVHCRDEGTELFKLFKEANE